MSPNTTKTDWWLAIGEAAIGAGIGLAIFILLAAVVALSQFGPFVWLILLGLALFHILLALVADGFSRVLARTFKKPPPLPVKRPAEKRPWPRRVGFWVGLIIGGTISWIETSDFTLEYLGWT